jgi:hypothetical protein
VAAEICASHLDRVTLVSLPFLGPLVSPLFCRLLLPLFFPLFVPLFLPLFLGAPVDLLTATDCPSRAAVAAELARLAPDIHAPSAQEQGAPRLSAEIRWVGDSLSIALRTPQGTLAAQRTLVRLGSCLDLAAASAVVIAAWQGEMRGDLGPDLPATERRASPPRTTSTEAIATTGREPLPRLTGHPWQVGVGAVASRGADFAPGILIDAELGRPRSRWAAALGLAATGAHALALGPNPGQSRWSRAALDLGARDRLWLGDSALDAHMAVAVAMIRFTGAGFGTNYTPTGFDWGIGGGLRWMWVARWLAPFVTLEGWAWPRQKSVAATGTDAEERLPSFELRAAAGLSFGRFR